ncbi:hypothetical protein VTL71DRAFT_4493 [Oculimacula yallundae]|uniref:Uncharacterized protein n=1 Tax=Oculimacula yallundae TaxID=86028 RepID=A0ABR4C270_9HELO
MTRRGTGLCAGFNLMDTRSLRTLYDNLKYWLRGGRSSHKGKFGKLSKLQRSTIEMIAQRMEHSPLLKDIVMSFLKLHRGDSTSLQLAARDMDTYAVTAAYEPKMGAYKEAEQAWKDRQPLSLPGNVAPDHETILAVILADIKIEKAAERARREAGYMATGFVSTGNGTLSNGSHDENKADLDSKTVLLRTASAIQNQNHIQPLSRVIGKSRTVRSNRNPLGSATHGQSNKQMIQTEQAEKVKTGKRKQYRAIDTDATCLTSRPGGHASKLKAGQKVDEGYEQSDSDDLAENPRKTKDPWKARIEPGYITIDGHIIDRTGAKRGIIEPWKLVFNFTIAKFDPHHTSQIIPGTEKPLTYVHSRSEKDFDWNDADHIKTLNNWRHQVFHRRVEHVRGKPRFPWLVSEKQALVDLAEAQLRLYGTLKWGRLANSFNRQNAGLTDGAGELLLTPGTRVSKVLGMSRAKPWRTASALLGAIKKDTDFQDLQRRINASVPNTASRKRKSNESDSEEDPEPSARPQPMMDRKGSKGVNGEVSKPAGVRKGRKRHHSGDQNMERSPARTSSGFF